ncbi:alpha 1,2-mannosyltransferase, partial [Lecanoromycetidae sp. Uapishka_2]
MLREFGSTLPVEIWMKDKKEEKAGWCKDIQQDGMICRRLSDYMDVSTLQHGYQLKINSILFSSFEQILFLDADNVPVKNPDPIFEAKTFKDTGVVLWPDYWKHTGAPLLPFEVGLADEASEMLRQDQTAESGQLVWDKKRHWKVSTYSDD